MHKAGQRRSEAAWPERSCAVRAGGESARATWRLDWGRLEDDLLRL